MNILEAIRDENLFRGYLEFRKGVTLEQWENWLTALSLLYGLGAPDTPEVRDLVELCTGRSVCSMPDNGFSTALFLTGRRSGKSRVAGVIGAFEGVMGGHEAKLAKGELGLVAVLAPTRRQAGIVKSNLRAALDIPILRSQVVRETAEGFELTNGISVSVMAGDWKTVRGFTLVCAIVDEAAFFGVDEESKVKSDTELMRALKPSLATVGGKLIGISSPYARKGWTYRQHKQNFGNSRGRTLVWNCSSRTMNPTLPQKVVDEAMEEDLASAKSEYMGEFRCDVSLFIPRTVIESLVVAGRKVLPRVTGREYVGFVDVSGGRVDDAAIAIAHKDGSVVLDYLKRYKPPFSPATVISDMARVLSEYRIGWVYGDGYAAEFTVSCFGDNGIRYRNTDRNKSELYVELLPRICTGSLELLDDDVLVSQLAGLERKTRSGGVDKIDHPQGGHDDVANAFAGVCYEVMRKRKRVGAFR